MSRRSPVALLTWAALATAALLYLGYHAAIAFGLDDTNHLETTLAMVVARQLRDGPSTLYGPFSGTQPLALIHAPLYYRLAALGAWPLARAGFDPTTAALGSGRALSMLGMLATMAAASRLATLDGGSPRAGWWAALLIAASPAFGSFPATVRPDTLALAFQTWGVALAWGWSRGEARHVTTAKMAGRDRPREDGPPRRKLALVAAYVSFGLAACTKQNFAVSGAITTALLGVQCLRGKARWAPVVGAMSAGVIVVLGYYGLEESLTGGRMSLAVFRLPAAFGRLNGATWGHVGTVFFEVTKLSAGLITLAVAALWAMPIRGLANRADGGLLLLFAGETAAMAYLCHASTGSWVNYAMASVLYAAILTARALARALDAGRPAWRLAPIALAGLILVVADGRYVGISAGARSAEQGRLRALFAVPSVAARPQSARYFVARPQYNRRYGRPDLVHDDWLYTAFEAQNAAEPRSAWLRQALASGPVRLVIVGREAGRDADAVEGMAESLPALGYREAGHVEGFDVWERP